MQWTTMSFNFVATSSSTLISIVGEFAQRGDQSHHCIRHVANEVLSAALSLTGQRGFKCLVEQMRHGEIFVK